MADPKTDTTTVWDRRRALLVLGGAAGMVAGCGGAQHPGGSPGGDHGGGHDEDLPATEDLMREHGLLRRIFVVYDEVARRLRAREAVDGAQVAAAARIMRAFGEDYHERAEERWVFPVVARAPALAPVVAVLRTQHDRGRALTDEITRLAAQSLAPGSDAAARLADRCEAFTRMYRPHAAREDTVIFPALRRGLSHHDFEEVGERMEEAEHATVGEEGFEHSLDAVARIETALGLGDLARFTP